MAGEELVDDFAEELVGYEGGVLVVGDDDAADAFGAAVGVKGVVWKEFVFRMEGLSAVEGGVEGPFWRCCCLGQCMGRRKKSWKKKSSYLALQHPVVVRALFSRRRFLRKGS